MKKKSLKCKLCKKIYMKPCDGKLAHCPNNISLSRSVDPYKLSYKQFRKIKKEKIIPSATVLKKWIEKNKLARAALSNSTAKAKGKKRARLVETTAPKKRARL